MSVVKFILLWIVLTVVMLVSWPSGVMLGNAITQSSPPQLAGGVGAPDPSSIAVTFLAVCIVNSLLLGLMIWQTRSYKGALRWMALVLYVWVVQFLLTQMETWFFVEGLVMSNAQILSIVIAGAVMSLVTVSTGILVAAKMNKADLKRRFSFRVNRWRPLWPPLLALTCIVYPLIYFTFGYFVAWQNEAVRMFYTHSAVLNSFFVETAKAIADGVYLYQVLRAGIWVMVSLPLIVMLQRERFKQYILMGALSALPSVQLFIPNPYMPADVAMAHFVETSISNFLWGITIVFLVNRSLDHGSIHGGQSKTGTQNELEFNPLPTTVKK